MPYYSRYPDLAASDAHCALKEVVRSSLRCSYGREIYFVHLLPCQLHSFVTFRRSPK